MHSAESSSRREFLRRAGQAGAAVALGGALIEANAASPGTPATLPALTSRPTTSQVDPLLKSVVADIRAREVVVEAVIHETLLGEMIDESVRLAARRSSPAAAWNTLLKPDDVVGIKFNHIGQEVISTTEPFARQVVESLKRAGIAPERIMLIEAPEQLTHDLRTRRCPVGFSGPKVAFGSGEDELAAVLQEVTAIINVPFLKTHSIAGMTCCLKNLSHALIRRPKLCHANGCSPFVGDILALPQIRPKLKLHLVNALRAVFDGGPTPSRHLLWRHCGILASTDPVATDAVATDILNDERSARKLRALGNREGQIGYLQAAAARGLGTTDQDYISVLRPTLF